MRPSVDGASDHVRVRRVVREQFAPVWRFLRRMGLVGRSSPRTARSRSSSCSPVACRRSCRLPSARFSSPPPARVAADLRKQGAPAELARRKVVDDEAELSAAVASTPAGLDTALDEQRARRLLDQICSADLPEELREVLVMCDIEELTMASVAEVLELPAGTVASRLRRARQLFSEGVTAVRARLEGGGGSEKETAR